MTRSGAVRRALAIDPGRCLALGGGVLLAAWLAEGSMAGQAPKQAFVPSPVRDSNLSVRLDLVGRMPSKINPTSPTMAGSQLLLIDQIGFVYRWDGTSAVKLLTPSTVPAGLKLTGPERVMNVAANASGAKLYVMFTSATVPGGIPRRMSPRPGTNAWSVLFEYDFDGAALSHPRPITAMQVRTGGHIGGGLTVLADGSILFAPGDNGDSYEDGRDYAQNPAVHLAKIVRIDPGDGSTAVVAIGVRNCQRLVTYQAGQESRLDFVDPGGWVAEELDSIRLSDLIGAPPIRNFGWGRHPADRKAREGTFYIGPTGNAVAVASDAEPGFQQPVAEFGREGAVAFAVSGGGQQHPIIYADYVALRRPGERLGLRSHPRASRDEAAGPPRQPVRQRPSTRDAGGPDRKAAARPTVLQFPRWIGRRLARAYRCLLPPHRAAGAKVISTGPPLGVTPAMTFIHSGAFQPGSCETPCGREGTRRDLISRPSE